MGGYDTILGVILKQLNVTEAINELSSAGANFNCQRLVKILKLLKFEVRDGKRGRHKVFMHPQIPHFTGGHFSCMHDKGQVKPVYTKSVKRVLMTYREELEKIT